MPEGDTIFRAARTLHRALAGKRVVRFESMLPALDRVHDQSPITGRIIEQVRASGKHLLMHFSGGLVLRTHMRMNGSWHVYRPGERWQRARRDMRVLVATEEFEAVGFRIPVAEFIRAQDIARHEALRRLGPDILSEAFAPEEAISRLGQHADTPIADALLNQRALAGLGNVYKSEVLFMCGVHPFAPVRTLDAATLAAIVKTARRVLLANVSETIAPMTTFTGFRRTTGRDAPTERLWVYGRGRLPCRRCGTPIMVRKQGPDARLTYWCPVCQAS
ncbi:MAG: endonuclease [Acidobacteriota bacterium]|jgi:endonuclease-8